MLARQLRKENELIAELVVAKELGLTLGQLRREMNYEEVHLWLVFFELQNQEREKTMNKAGRHR